LLRFGCSLKYSLSFARTFWSPQVSNADQFHVQRPSRATVTLQQTRLAISHRGGQFPQHLRGAEFNTERLRDAPNHAHALGDACAVFRLMISLALTLMERTTAPIEPRVLFVLEELPILGYMQALDSAIGQMAGLGVKIFSVIQNFGQIKTHYRDSWETFLANSGALIAFGNSDTTTLEILRKRLGQTAIVERVSSGSVGSPSAGAGLSQREERQALPLLEEDEIRRAFARQKQAALILTMDHDPAVVERINYDENPFFAGLYDEDPRHPKRKAA
jgi:hypothetical protein